MSKYIIDVGDAYAEHICGKGDMLCLPVRINEFEDNWLNTNIPLTPYTEPDTEKVREEAYEQGLSDAWETARKIAISEESGGLTCREMQRIFCTDETDEIFDMSASEAIEKIRQYEQEKEEQIQVGDEVRNIEKGWIAVVSNIDGECMTLMDATGALGDGYHVNRFTKTGRRFPEIAAVLEKMRGGQDG